jgi:hypothetical protein
MCQKNDACDRTSTIRVEIVLDPVHFCGSAMGALAKPLKLMVKPLRNEYGMSIA